MRFCLVTTFYPPYSFGGDGFFVQQLADLLAEQGHWVDVVHNIDAFRILGGRIAAESAENHHHPRISVHGLTSLFGFLSPLAMHQTGRPSLIGKRLRELLAEPYDVIHYHNTSLIGGPKVLEYGRAIKLYTLHEYWLVCPTHLLLKYGRKPCTKRSCFICTLLQRRPPQLWRHTSMMEKAAKEVDAFIAPSRFATVKHQELGFGGVMVEIPNFSVFYSSNGVADREDQYNPTSAPYFLYVGRLERFKGILELLEVFESHGKANLVIAGTGPLRAHIEEACRRSPRIKFAGLLRRELLSQLYRHTTAVIVPSLCYEIFPLVMIEAFSHGKPVIARHIGSLPEIVETSRAGISYRDQAELAEAIDLFLSDSEKTRDMGLCGYRAYKRLWSPEAYLTRYMELIAEVSDKKQNTRK